MPFIQRQLNPTFVTFHLWWVTYIASTGRVLYPTFLPSSHEHVLRTVSPSWPPRSRLLREAAQTVPTYLPTYLPNCLTVCLYFLSGYRWVFFQTECRLLLHLLINLLSLSLSIYPTSLSVCILHSQLPVCSSVLSTRPVNSDSPLVYLYVCQSDLPSPRPCRNPDYMPTILPIWLIASRRLLPGLM